MNKKIETKGMDETDLARRKGLQRQLRLWYDRRESYWRQIAKVNHIKLNDRNNRFFPTIAMGKKKRKWTHVEGWQKESQRAKGYQKKGNHIF